MKLVRQPLNLCCFPLAGGRFFPLAKGGPFFCPTRAAPPALAQAWSTRSLSASAHNQRVAQRGGRGRQTFKGYGSQSLPANLLRGAPAVATRLHRSSCDHPTAHPLPAIKPYSRPAPAFLSSFPHFSRKMGRRPRRAKKASPLPRGNLTYITNETKEYVKKPGRERTRHGAIDHPSDANI